MPSIDGAAEDAPATITWTACTGAWSEIRVAKWSDVLECMTAVSCGQSAAVASANGTIGQQALYMAVPEELLASKACSIHLKARRL
jgi:hypothetical protein